MLQTIAFSRNFHAIGTLFSQHMYEINKSPSSKEGKDTPPAFKFEETWIAHNKGSLLFPWAHFVSSKIPSHTLLLLHWMATSISPDSSLQMQQFMEKKLRESKRGGVLCRNNCSFLKEKSRGGGKIWTWDSLWNWGARWY